MLLPEGESRAERLNMLLSERESRTGRPRAAFRELYSSACKFVAWFALVIKEHSEFYSQKFDLPLSDTRLEVM